MNRDDAPTLLPGFLTLGLCLLIGLVLGGLLLGSQIKDLKLADRYVTVKGLVERTVKADTAIWNISFKEAGNDLPTVFGQSERDKASVLAFLTAQGFTPVETTIGQIQVTDRLAVEYGTGEAKGSRYIVQQLITVVTKDVDKASRAGAKTDELVKSGVALGNNSSIAYKFNGLNNLKPDMITEATRNARSAAQRFAADSGSAVGAIRSATQGTFSISAADAGSATAVGEEGDGGGFMPPNQADASIMKRVRVVATVEYYFK
jgi:uncharacterized protein